MNKQNFTTIRASRLRKGDNLIVMYAMDGQIKGGDEIEYEVVHRAQRKGLIEVVAIAKHPMVSGTITLRMTPQFKVDIWR